jgi:hypothetical protein
MESHFPVRGAAQNQERKEGVSMPRIQVSLSVEAHDGLAALKLSRDESIDSVVRRLVGLTPLKKGRKGANRLTNDEYLGEVFARVDAGLSSWVEGPPGTWREVPKEKTPPF